MEEDKEENELPASILNSLGLNPFEKEPLLPVVIPSNPAEDADAMRAIQYRTLQKLERHLDEAIAMSENAQHPRAVEVVAGLGKVILDGTQTTMVTNEKQQKLIKGTGDTPSIGTVHNNIIVAASDDMFDAIKTGLRNNKIIDG